MVFIAHVRSHKEQSTTFTYAALPFEEFDNPQGFKRMPLKPLPPIEPISIKRTFRSNYFDVPFDFSFLVLEQVVLPIGETDDTIQLFPVTTITPLRPFTRVTEGGPTAKFVIELSGHPLKNFFGPTGFVVIGPAPNDGIEFAN